VRDSDQATAPLQSAGILEARRGPRPEHADVSTLTGLLVAEATSI